MKIRQGFVSNSSSSSFVLGTKGDPQDITVKIETQLCEAVDKMITAESMDELVVWLKENYYLSKDRVRTHEQVLEDYGLDIKEIQAIFDRGETVVYCKVSTDGDNPVSRLLYNSHPTDVAFTNADLVFDKGGW